MTKEKRTQQGEAEMKILILGLGKSGTTALLYKVAGGLPACQTFQGGSPGKIVSHHADAAFKFTYNEDKGRGLELFEKHVSEACYDRKIWIARDPRDNAVSRLLFRWYRGAKRAKEQYRECLALVVKKERHPESVPFYSLFRYTGLTALPPALEQVIGNERKIYGRMCDFVKGLKEDWFIFQYEDMIDNKFERLNAYLGFNVQEETKATNKEKKVIRKKSKGDWRHWFTPEDVELFRPVYTAYMDLIGYDSNDWQLSSRQVIEPEYASIYMKRLPRKRLVDSLRKRVVERPVSWLTGLRS
jgi:hypothetical protein